MKNTNCFNVIVVGAGAAGMVAAAKAAEAGSSTLLLEKNNKAGVKILISGGTRCNITHATDRRGIIKAFGKGGKFLHSALAALSPDDVVSLIQRNGVPTKIEDTGKIFPVSNSAVDVRDAFLRIQRSSGAKLWLGTAVERIAKVDSGFLVSTPQRQVTAKRVIITTGGQSYPGCGTTGDGYGWASAFGHSIVTPNPALVPLTTRSPWVPTLQGLTLPDVTVRIHDPANGPPNKKNALAERRSSLLFTHFGLSGPAAMDVSRAVSQHNDPKSLQMLCDFLPDQSEQELMASLDARIRETGKRNVHGILAKIVPRRLAETVLQLSDTPPDRRAAELSKRERQQIVEYLKRATVLLLDTLGFKKAEVTAGGVSLDEVDSRTMESKIVPGLYFAGEILNLDGPIGGYNFQAAFSTGWLAGVSAGRAT